MTSCFDDSNPLGDNFCWCTLSDLEQRARLAVAQAAGDPALLVKAEADLSEHLGRHKLRPGQGWEWKMRIAEVMDEAGHGKRAAR